MLEGIYLPLQTVTKVMGDVRTQYDLRHRWTLWLCAIMAKVERSEISKE